MSSIESQVTPKTLSHPYRWDWIAAILLIGMMQSLGGRLTATEWVNNIEITLILSFWGCVAGLVLGISNFSSLGVLFFSSVYGLFTISRQLGLILGSGIEWAERLVSLWGRYKVSIHAIINQESVTDPLLFLTIVSMIVWVVSVYTGVALVRQRRVWRVVLPGAIGIMVINTYSYQDDISARFLAFYIFLILFLVARLYYLDRREDWQQMRISVPFHISFDLLIGAVLTSALLVIVAWNTPTAVKEFTSAEETWDRIITPFKSATDRLDNVFAALKSSVGFVRVGGVKGYYGDDIQLGLGIPQTDDLIFTIEVPNILTTEPRYYWRARYYDSYQDGRWTNAKIKTQMMRPDEFDISLTTYNAPWEANIKVTTHIPLSTLYAPSQPNWVSRPVELEVNPTQDDFFEIVAMHATPPLMVGEVYEVQVSRSDITIKDLREAGVNYPVWVTNKYLQIPESVGERTKILAEQITSNADTPFDKATAITEYLRDHIEYLDTVSEPPEDVEPIEWMLFDSQQGFCNYYATAEVMMLRSLGIPARFSVGYSQGETSLESAERPALGGNIGEIPGDFMETTGDKIVYFVRANNLHSWPEVFFPAYGWIEFEPTANQRPLLRPLDDEDLDLSSADSEGQGASTDDRFGLDDQLFESEFNIPEDTDSFIGRPDSPIYSFGAFIVVIGLAAVLWWGMRKVRGLPPISIMIEKKLQKSDIPAPYLLQKWARWSSLSAMERAYHSINRSLMFLGETQEPAASPSMRAKSLASQLPSSSDVILELLMEYQNWLYGGQLANVRLSRKLARSIEKQAILEKIRRIFSRST